jgi:hypothetical protein
MMECLEVPEGYPGVAPGVYIHLDTLVGWLEEVADLCITEDDDSAASAAFSAVARDLQERFDQESMLTEPIQLVPSE